ncbi:MAG: branched-chain amino acid ABC transporter permease [Anaerolineae bacterium]|nr:branched-chain amino acid ABC transporter permease [Anaerolineae bacterium]MDW8171678.1 branched-chain amino acid ABC transporter permease [Anaerolineae bacterium]
MATLKTKDSPNFLQPLQDFYKENQRLINVFLALAALLLFYLAVQERLSSLRPSRMVQSTVTGILIGGVYALIALGIVIINKASGVFNFAHGFMMLLGGMIFYSFFMAAEVTLLASGGMALVTVLIVMSMNGWRSLLKPRNAAIAAGAVVVLTLLLSIPTRDEANNLMFGAQLLRGVIGAVCGAVTIGLLIERVAIRPLIGQPLFAAVLMTLAVGEGLMRGLTNIVWGSVELSLPLFDGVTALGIPQTIVIEAGDFLGGDVRIFAKLLVPFILALIAFVAFVLFFRYTNVGLAMRASAENQNLAQSTGLRVRFILAVAWAIAAILAATAGTLQGGATSLSLNLPLLALRAFPAVLLGGLESITGALVGGLVIGIVQEWANLLFPGTQAGTELAPYVVLMIVLVVRPDGLFGEKRIERI